MKGDYSKIPFDERKKMQHYRKVYHQQGKVLLDSDLNENTDLLHYQMKTLVKDGLCGSPNIGFRIGRGVPLLPVDDHRYIGEGKGWSCTNEGTLTVDYFEKFEGKGSLKLENATEVIFSFEKPVDLSKYRYLRLALRIAPSSNYFPLIRFDGINGTITGLEEPLDQNGFAVIKYVFPPNAVLDNITKVILTEIDSNTEYHLGAVECSPPMFTLEPMTELKGWSFDTDKPESAEISVDGEVIKVSQITKLYREHFSTVDFSKFKTMEFAISAISSNSTSLEFYVSDKDGNTSYWEIKNIGGELEKYSIDITTKKNDSQTSAELAFIEKYGFRELSDSEGYYYHFGSILYEMSLENNFVISGKYPLSGETGRLYVDGELYEKEGAETYLNQEDYSSASSIEPDNEIRKDLVYVDVWQRHVTSAEDPELREVAVGVDTCNRMKGVAQVKVLAGETFLPPDLKSTGGGRLSTAVEYIETEKLCEITSGVEYTGLENRLYRVEIHTHGEVGIATYKWSKNNGSTVSQIVENVKEDALSVRVKNVKLFEIGDIIEITDDRVEFADRKYNNNQSIKPRGELRKITSIDRDKNVLGWEKEVEGASDDTLSITGGLPHDYTAEGELTTHPRVVKWDGVNKTSNEEILEDGITIRFSGSDMLPGDYWTFTARENTRTVEKLVNEPPQGVVHHYYPLATIKWKNGEIINVTDLRTRFEPLCGITAADLGFDNANTPIWTDADNVQQALERITFPKAEGIEFTNKCMDLYGTGTNVQDALDHLCNGITVPSLTLKGKDGEQDNWPKLECSESRDLVGIENGLQIGMNTDVFKNFYMVSNLSSDIRGFRLYKGNGFHLLTVSENGNVGIGGLRPKNKLDVKGGVVIGAGYSGKNTAPDDGLLVEGKVGIGTSEPEAKLDVRGDINIPFGKLRFDAGTNEGTAGIASSDTGSIYGEHDKKTENSRLVLEIRDNSNDAIVLRTAANGSTKPSVDMVKIANNVLLAPNKGNVGIGTTNTKFGRLTIQDSAVPLTFRDPGKEVDDGGLWRMPLENGNLRFDVNTGAQGSEFAENYITPLKMTKEGEVIVAGELKAPFFKAGQGNSATVYKGKWYRIAKGYKANAEFTLREEMNVGDYSFLTFRIGISFFDESSMSFTVLNHSRSIETTFTKIRVLQRNYGDIQYLEVYVNKNDRKVNYSIYDNLSGWQPVNWEVGDIPIGYSDIEFDVDNLFVVGDYTSRFTINREGNVGIGTSIPKNKLDVEGGAVIGLEYSGLKIAPTNGLLVQGNVGIGTSIAKNKLDVEGGAVIGLTYSGSKIAPTNGLLVQGDVGIGTSIPKNKLDVEGGAVIGLTYSGLKIAPTNGLLVQGNVGIGTEDSPSRLTVKGGEQILVSGTVEVNQNSLKVIGTDTSFNTEVRLGDMISFGVYIRQVTKIVNDNELYINSILHYFKGPILVSPNLFRVNNNNDAARFVITNPGNVGINTAYPDYDLHTNGRSYAITRYGGGIDFAEYFESLDGKEIPVGTPVLLDGGKIRPAKKNEIPIGIISSNSIIVGGVHTEWPKKYLRDEIGNLIMEEYKEELMVPKKENVARERQKVDKKMVTEEVTRTDIVFENGKYIQKEISETVTREVEELLFEEVDLYDASGKNIGKHQIPVMETYEEEIEILDENDQPVLVGTGEFVKKQSPKLNPEYDESLEYVSREQRPEWNCVGLLGQIPLRKSQPVAPTWVKIKDMSKDVELWLVR